MRKHIAFGTLFLFLSLLELTKSLQAIGSKIEILALTDVEYVVFWFNELPLLCALLQRLFHRHSPRAAQEGSQ